MSVEAPPQSVDVEPGTFGAAARDGAPDVTAEPDRESEDTSAPADGGAQSEAPASVLLIAAAAGLSSAAAGWVAAGVFHGGLPRIIGLLVPSLGAGTVALSYRTKRPSTLQYLAVPLVVFIGALLVLPDAKGGSANLPSLVLEAIRGGGIAEPPVAFDPGWRFLLVVLVGLLAVGASSLAASLDRPMLGVFIPIPITFAALLVQPKGGSSLATLVALVLVVGGLGLAYGADLAREGDVSGKFELRRLLRAAALTGALMAALGLLTQIDFLFPEPNDEQVIPPKKPEQPPPQADRVLFTVSSDVQIPWRLGVLDVYDGTTWLTPPYDTSRFERVPASGAVTVAGVEDGIEGAPTGKVAGAEGSEGSPLRVTFTVSDIQGHTIPQVANLVRVKSDSATVDYDPRTQSLRLPEQRPSKGMTYTVEAPVPPGAPDLAKAPAPPVSMKPFLDVPPPPPEVADLLAQAPQTNLFDRLQFVRNEYYSKVIAAGAGKPVSVPPARVGEMLSGKEATPFEITAGEVLLARWAGIPARIGYGYYGGERKQPTGKEFEVRPRHGASWLETYFEGYGWIPIVGTPPRAKSSLDQDQKNKNPTIKPTDELSLTVYVPVRLANIQLLFRLVQYWVAKFAPWIMALGLALWLYPGPLKSLRRVRRERWARAHGDKARIAAAYAEMRDVASDYNIGFHAQSPLEFVATTDADPEHLELAWLVTRAIWGDLARDIRPTDVETGEQMAQSLIKRLRRAQSPLNRVVAYGSRVSLRDPYSDELPNLWPSSAGLRSGLGLPRWWTLPHLPLGRRPRLATAAGLAAIVVFVALGAVSLPFGGGGDGVAQAQSLLPERIAPEELGSITFKREREAEAAFAEAGATSLVVEGQVYSIHQGDAVQGALQIASFKDSVLQRDDELREGVLDGFAGGGDRFELRRIGADRLYILRLPEQRILVWFPSNSNYYEVLIARQGFAEAERVFAQVLAYQRGEAFDELLDADGLPDPRRGIDER